METSESILIFSYENQDIRNPQEQDIMDVNNWSAHPPDLINSKLSEDKLIQFMSLATYFARLKFKEILHEVELRRELKENPSFMDDGNIQFLLESKTH
ncbi:MAG: hypothetical protein EZS28_030183 [Streblomastix strix]|uniref:Uncharacterized protein n=1 Tax=Streblomastix strix TaxID=222440 RepID=A0A5J4UVW0_9EUKA|nr:MAG: hypothetical protein EZS28_030183 [Streblomastix strix]